MCAPSPPWPRLCSCDKNRDAPSRVFLCVCAVSASSQFSIGLISALFSFGFTLVSMIWEYKVGYISGLLFFLVAMSGASAMVATFIGGMASVAVGGVYAVAKSASNNQRLRDREGRRPRYVQHQHQRPQYAHYD